MEEVQITSDETDRNAAKVEEIAFAVPDAARAHVRGTLLAHLASFPDDVSGRCFLDNVEHALAELTRVPRQISHTHVTLSDDDVLRAFDVMVEECARTYADIQDFEEKQYSRYGYDLACAECAYALRHGYMDIAQVADGMGRVRRMLNDSYKVPVTYQGNGNGHAYARPHEPEKLKTLIGKCFEPSAKVREELEHARMHVDSVLQRGSDLSQEEREREYRGAYHNLERARWFHGEEGENPAVEREIEDVENYVRRHLEDAA